MTASTIELVCLDMAGTTVRDDGAVEAAFTAAMATQGIEPGTTAFDDALRYVRETMGQSKIEVFTALFSGIDRARQANEAFEAAYAAGVASNGVRPIEGAAEAIAQLREAGTRVCLTTGFSPITRDAILDALGWIRLPDLVLSPSDAGRGRPYADMIWVAALRCRVTSMAAVAVAGDTASDLLAGHRSGARVVAGVLTGAQDRATLARAPHTHLLESVADLPATLVSLDGP